MALTGEGRALVAGLSANDLTALARRVQLEFDGPSYDIGARACVGSAYARLCGIYGTAALATEPGKNAIVWESCADLAGILSRPDQERLWRELANEWRSRLREDRRAQTFDPLKVGSLVTPPGAACMRCGLPALAHSFDMTSRTATCPILVDNSQESRDNWWPTNNRAARYQPAEAGIWAGIPASRAENYKPLTEPGVPPVIVTLQVRTPNGRLASITERLKIVAVDGAEQVVVDRDDLNVFINTLCNGVVREIVNDVRDILKGRSKGNYPTVDVELVPETPFGRGRRYVDDETLEEEEDRGRDGD